MIAQLEEFVNRLDTIKQSAIAQSMNEELISPEEVFSSLSFTHIVQLLSIKDPVEKAFYEIQAIKGIWSVRELKRQINSNLYLRTGLRRYDPTQYVCKLLQGQYDE